MSLSQSYPRSVIRTHRFDRECEEILGTAERADALLIGLEWAIARRPEAGHHTPVDRIMMRHTDEWGGTPAVNLYYTYDADAVYFLSLRRASDFVADEGDDLPF